MSDAGPTWSYARAVAVLDELAQHGWKLDLERIQQLCALAGHPERAFRATLVGGSAGKGSTCTLLAAILRAQGLRVGLAPKPHLLTHRERAQVDGRLISEAEFAALLREIAPLAATVTAAAGPPTVFEVLTLLAFLHFVRAGVDHAVVEVGLGGRFDATNVLPARMAIITSIGLDHTEFLGDTPEEIAFEKAGIIKTGRPMLTGAAGPALAVIRRMADERAAPLWALDHQIRAERIRVDASGTTFDFACPAGSLPNLRLAMVGAHQARNAALAAAAALWPEHREPGDPPPATPAEVREGLLQARVPGRLQQVRERPLVLLDGAHSPDRARALAEALSCTYLRGADVPPGRELHLVLGCSRGHSAEEVAACLAPAAAVVYATRSAHPASLPAGEVGAAVRAAAPRTQVLEVEPVGAAVAAALAAAAPQDAVVVTGSLFVVGEALAVLAAPGGPAPGSYGLPEPPAVLPAP